MIERNAQEMPLRGNTDNAYKLYLESRMYVSKRMMCHKTTQGTILHHFGTMCIVKSIQINETKNWK